jgi:hypothetical protein
VLSLLVTTLSPLQRIFDTEALTAAQWGICLLGPIVYLAVMELGKWFDRRTGEVRAARLWSRRRPNAGLSRGIRLLVVTSGS